jgi:hypothetical protein
MSDLRETYKGTRKNIFDVQDDSLPFGYRLIRNCIISRGTIKPGYPICDAVMYQLQSINWSQQ